MDKHVSHLIDDINDGRVGKRYLQMNRWNEVNSEKLASYFVANKKHFNSIKRIIQFVRVKNNENDANDSWILAGDLVYVFDNTEGRDGDGTYIPVGLASGSQTNLLLATDKMMNLVNRDPKRIIPIHEQRLVERFPSRVSNKGLHIVEIALAHGETSKVEGESSSII